MGLTRMSDFETSQRVKSGRTGTQGLIYYIGYRYHSLIKRDVERYCPGVQLIQIDTISRALRELAITRPNTIILDDNLPETDVQRFLNTIRSSTHTNSDTPVRILALQPAEWVPKLARKYRDVVVIPSDEPPHTNPFGMGV